MKTTEAQTVTGPGRVSEPALWRRYGRLGLFAALVGLSLIAMAGVWGNLWRIGTQDEESSHILLVPLVAAWLAWVRRGRAASLRPGGEWVGPLVVALGAGALIFGYQWRIETMRLGSLVLVIVGAAISLWGLDVLRKFGPALAVLVLMVPVWLPLRQAISYGLESVSSLLTADALRAVGVPVWRAGNLLTVNDVPVNVVEACSGMRMVFAVGLVLILFVFSQPYRWYVRAVILLLMPAVALACNFVRLVPTIWAYGYAGASVADLIHVWGGWFMVGVAFALCLGIVWLLRWARVPLKREPDGSRSASVTPTPARAWRSVLPVGAAAMALVVLGIASGTLAGAHSFDAYHQRVRAAIRGLPDQVGTWSGEAVDLPAPAIRKLQPNAVYCRMFRGPVSGRAFQLALVHCRVSDDLAVHTPWNCYPHAGWRQGLTQNRVFEVRGRTVPMREYIFRRFQEGRFRQIVVVNCFVTPGEGVTPGEHAVAEAAKLARDNQRGGAQVQFVFPASFSLDARREVLEEFLPQLEPVFDAIRDQ